MPGNNLDDGVHLHPALSIALKRQGNKDLTMTKTILITGALAGIGRETARIFAERGYRIVASGRREEIGRKLELELRAIGGDALFIRADVRKEEEVRSLVEQTVDRFGSLDIAINNAGTEGKPGPIVDQTPESLNDVFDTNVLGVLLCLKYELKVMLERKSGSIVNLSSTMGRTAFANQSIYTASKHAVEGLSKTAALEAAPFGVRVNTIAPGPTDTDMLHRLTGGAEGLAKMATAIPLGRNGTAREIAEAILFISSDQAGFITGQSLAVNGGRTLG